MGFGTSGAAAVGVAETGRTAALPTVSKRSFDGTRVPIEGNRPLDYPFIASPRRLTPKLSHVFARSEITSAGAPCQRFTHTTQAEKVPVSV
jgi:hypothetical protein